MNEAVSVEQISAELIALLGSDQQVEPFSRRGVPFDLATAYQIVSRVGELRRTLGQKPVGRKIGFTNRSIWGPHGISAPIWNYVFDTTVSNAVAGQSRIRLIGMPEPRIEPELVLHLAQAPEAGMTAHDLIECIDWVAPGFEVVCPIFPNWDFSAADAAAAFGVHSALVVGGWLDISSARADHAAAMSMFSVELRNNAGICRRGQARDVLGGPVEALKFLVEELARYPVCDPLRAGELVTTGTLTEAMPVRAGEAWAAHFDGIGLGPLHLAFD